MTTPEWRAPPDTMREDPAYLSRHMPEVGDERSHPELCADTRDHVARWVTAILGAPCEWARDRRPHPFDDGNWILLVSGSEWTCRVIESLRLGSFRVVRVVPMEAP